ncbi:xanthine dehydrogenase accessory protein XdhC [Pararhizobium mangrovi]|uniref:Xanthine dehydrogenase accessory protein XdhC n=1 Tax=Pararhizobium mangrovi TaxID=2590452 RepID=A0A506U100_9HYPH|nr:xanthine dehydrogenase accessory protein XdhC [Pararhizobium mangrovi]TPW26625.1 xanthine dehydrogenase accessory protein XdhC [Pararhizobium mangrovi]
MSRARFRLERFAAEHEPLARITVARARGSTPRETGAWMLVGHDATFGTIGGGRLEFLAIDHARQLLTGGAAPAMAIPLGPELGQCCGGNVDLAFETMDADALERLGKTVVEEEAAQPQVIVFGAGHVGRALAHAFSALPVRLVVVETRADALTDLPESVEAHCTAMPETHVEAAPAGSAFIVLTHDHALDFLLVAAALKRRDAAYVGMIGSATKRATFERWHAREADGTTEERANLVCPIGGAEVHDKRPEVIAALVAAEVLRTIL